MKVIAALNGLNTPWIAILVIVMGMFYSLASKHFGITGDGASAVMGAGIGLLTGQALARSQQSAEPMPPPIAEPTVK